MSLNLTLQTVENLNYSIKLKRNESAFKRGFTKDLGFTLFITSLLGISVNEIHFTFLLEPSNTDRGCSKPCLSSWF